MDKSKERDILGLKRHNYLFSLALISTVFISGCIQIPIPENLILAHPIVKEFLKGYPNSEIKVTLFLKTQSQNLIESIRNDCNNPYLEPKTFYRVTIEDKESGLSLLAWIDWDNQSVECVVKKPSGKEPTKPKEEIKPEEQPTTTTTVIPKVEISLDDIAKFRVGVAGAKGNGVSYTIKINGIVSNLENLCGTYPNYECTFSLIIREKRLELGPYEGFTGKYLLYYCETATNQCIEDKFGTTVPATLEINKKGTLYQDTKTITLSGISEAQVRCSASSLVIKEVKRNGNQINVLYSLETGLAGLNDIVVEAIGVGKSVKTGPFYTDTQMKSGESNFATLELASTIPLESVHIAGICHGKYTIIAVCKAGTPCMKAEEIDYSCQNADFRVYSCSYNSTYQRINLILENIRSVELKNLVALVIYPDNTISTVTLNGSLPAGFIKSFPISGVTSGYSSIKIKTECPDLSASASCR